MANITISFDAWKEGKVGATEHPISVLLPKRLDIKLEAVSSQLLRELIHSNKASQLVGIRFAPDGKRVLAGDYPGGTVALWDVETGKRATTIETGTVTLGNADYYFPTPDWKSLYVHQAGTRKVESIERDGKRLRRWEFAGAVRSWNLTTGEPQKTFHHVPPRYIGGMQLSSDGNRFITYGKLPGTYEESQTKALVSVWDARTGTYFDLPDNTDISYHGRFSPDGTVLAAIAVDKNSYATALKVFDSATGKEKLSIPVKDKNASVSIASFSPDGKLMLVGYQVFSRSDRQNGWQYRLDVLESGTGRVVATLDGEPNDHLYGYFAADGQTIAAVQGWSKEAKLILFNVPDNRAFRTIVLNRPNQGERGSTGWPAFSPDGKRLAIVSRIYPYPFPSRDRDALDLLQPRIHLIDVGTGELRETLVAPQSFGQDVCFSPDGRTLAAAGQGRVLLFDVTPRAK